MTRRRQAHADDEIVIAVVTVDRATDGIFAGPELIIRGIVHACESTVLLDATKDRIRDSLSRHTCDLRSEDGRALAQQLCNANQRYIHRDTGCKPMVMEV